MMNLSQSKLIALLSLLCLAIFPLNAQTFQSEILKSIAKAIALPENAGEGSTGYFHAGFYNGTQLVACRNCNNVITHIGYAVFDNAVKSEQPAAVYDFIERYLLELDCIKTGFTIDRKLKDDKFVIMGGSVNNVTKLYSASVSMQCQDDKYYKVVWKKDGEILLDIVFPVQYELLLGMSKVEIEKKVKAQIMGSSHSQSVHVHTPELTEITPNVYQSQPASNYYVESLSTACYYKKNDDGVIIPIFDSNQKWYSAANLIEGIIDDISGYKLYIEQRIYGFEKETYTVSFQQWLDYCQNNDITVYFAVEEEREDGMLCLLIGQSKKLGFNHMMSVIIPDTFVENPNTVLKATLNAYIPTQNVKDLYQENVKQPNREI